MSYLIPSGNFSDTSSETPGATSHGHSTPQEVETPSFESSQTDNRKVKKRGRKGHTKSRRGCFNCKRVRIKCKENRPTCDYCAHRNLECQWPDTINAPSLQDQSKIMTRNTNNPVHFPVTRQLHVAGPVHNAQDLRLFYHFINKAYPHHPIGCDSIWKHEIPVISRDYEYLVHAMLALSAADMASDEPNPLASAQLSCKAITHRISAIKTLNSAISAGLSRFEQGNAMLATCFVLLFQSALIEDGLAEYMTFTRGGVAVAFQMGIKQHQILFKNLFDGEAERIVDPFLMKAPLTHPGLVRKALESLERIKPLCEHVVEVELYGMLLATARALITSSRDAMVELRKIYGHFSYFMPQSSFNHLINPANRVCQILQSHFVAMLIIMTPITRCDLVLSDKKEKEHENQVTMGRWFKPLHADVPEEWATYYDWPMWVEKEITQGRVFNGVVKAEDLESFHDGEVYCQDQYSGLN